MTLNPVFRRYEQLCLYQLTKLIKGQQKLDLFLFLKFNVTGTHSMLALKE